MPENPMKQHLGNGVFAEIEDGQIKLTTLGLDNNTANTIYLNDEALCGLNQFAPVETLEARYADLKDQLQAVENALVEAGVWGIVDGAADTLDEAINIL